jgi:Rrf2 family protein
MLSQTCKAAIKSVVFLATLQPSSTKVSLKAVSVEINENEHTVGKLLQILVKKNIINSLKGPAGGFYMTTSQLSQPIINVVEAIDGTGFFSECGLGLSKCSETHPCPIHDQFKVPRDLLKKLFTENRISDFCSVVQKGFAFLND